MKPRVIMWANYRRGPSLSVPSPFDGDHSIEWWYDRVSGLAAEWAGIGVTDVLFPQPLKTNAGPYPGADGYGVYDDYDLGSKNTPQFGGVETRFGNVDKLLRAIAICKANGLNVLLDIVPHQRMGGRNGVYQYGSSTGTTNGRFPKHPSCFRGLPPRVPEDPVPDVPDDYSFGDEMCPINAYPQDYVLNGLLEAGDWIFRRTDADGGRLDDMKGMAVEFVNKYLAYGAMNGKWFMGEYADGNSNDTNWWCGQVNEKSSALDFDFHYNMAEVMCNNLGGNFNMASLQGRGMISSNPMKAVPFVESMDSDTDGFATIVNNKELGYALMLCGQGLPMIYVRDYLQEPDCYGLKDPIANLCWVNNKLANGATQVRWATEKLYVFERTGYPGLLVPMNGDVWNDAWPTVNVQTAFGPSVQLHDYSGHNTVDIWTDTSGRVTLSVPPGANGTGYGCWSRANLDTPIEIMPRSTTQTFFGADDLDIAPIGNTTTLVGKIWVAAHTAIELELITHPSVTDEEEKLDILVTVSDPGMKPATLESVDHTGWYTISISSSTQLTESIPFELKVTYTATQHLTAAQIATDPVLLPATKAVKTETLGEEIAELTKTMWFERAQKKLRKLGKL
jgi:alpha-amylase